MTRRSDFDRRQAVARLYDEACAAIDKERWQEAVEKLDRVRDIDLHFPGAEWRQQQAHKWYRIAKLHEMGQQHMRLERWHDALSCFRHIRQEAGEYKNVAILQRICEHQLIPSPLPDNRRQIVLATSAVAAGFVLATLGVQLSSSLPWPQPDIRAELDTSIPTATQDFRPTTTPAEATSFVLATGDQTVTPAQEATQVPPDDTPQAGATPAASASAGANPVPIGPTSTRRPTSTPRPPTLTPSRFVAPPTSTRPPATSTASPPPGSTATPSGEITPEATATPAVTLDASPTSPPPTPTTSPTVGVLLFTETPSPTPAGTDTPVPTTLPPTATFTATPVPPTPTFTATPVPPTPTFTRTPTPVPPTATRTPTPVPTAAPQFIIAKEYDFLPSGLQAQPGAHVRLTLSNQGAQLHSWVLKDGAGNTLAKVTAAPGQNALLDFNAPVAAGVYTIICDVADHAQLGMKGQLTVR